MLVINHSVTEWEEGKTYIKGTYRALLSGTDCKLFNSSSSLVWNVSSTRSSVNPLRKIFCVPTEQALLRVLSRHSVQLFIYSLLIMLTSIKNCSSQNHTQLEIPPHAPCYYLDKVGDSIIHLPQMKPVCLSSWDFSVFQFPSSTISLTFSHPLSNLLKALRQGQSICVHYLQAILRESKINFSNILIGQENSNKKRKSCRLCYLFFDIQFLIENDN